MILELELPDLQGWPSVWKLPQGHDAESRFGQPPHLIEVHQLLEGKMAPEGLPGPGR